MANDNYPPAAIAVIASVLGIVALVCAFFLFRRKVPFDLPCIRRRTVEVEPELGGDPARKSDIPAVILGSGASGSGVPSSAASSVLGSNNDFGLRAGGGEKGTVMTNGSANSAGLLSPSSRSSSPSLPGTTNAHSRRSIPLEPIAEQQQRRHMGGRPRSFEPPSRQPSPLSADSRRSSVSSGQAQPQPPVGLHPPTLDKLVRPSLNHAHSSASSVRTTPRSPLSNSSAFGDDDEQGNGHLPVPRRPAARQSLPTPSRSFSALGPPTTTTPPPAPAPAELRLGSPAPSAGAGAQAPAAAAPGAAAVVDGGSGGPPIVAPVARHASPPLADGRLLPRRTTSLSLPSGAVSPPPNLPAITTQLPIAPAAFASPTSPASPAPGQFPLPPSDAASAGSSAYPPPPAIQEHGRTDSVESAKSGPPTVVRALSGRRQRPTVVLEKGGPAMATAASAAVMTTGAPSSGATSSHAHKPSGTAAGMGHTRKPSGSATTVPARVAPRAGGGLWFDSGSAPSPPGSSDSHARTHSKSKPSFSKTHSRAVSKTHSASSHGHTASASPSVSHSHSHSHSHSLSQSSDTAVTAPSSTTSPTEGATKGFRNNGRPTSGMGASFVVMNRKPTSDQGHPARAS